MSKWTEFRDGIESTLDFQEVTEDMKNNLANQMLTEVLPTAEAIANKFIGAIRDQAKDESGWCKIRDSVVLPAVIDFGLCATRKLLSVTVNNTKQ